MKDEQIVQQVRRTIAHLNSAHTLRAAAAAYGVMVCLLQKAQNSPEVRCGVYSAAEAIKKALIARGAAMCPVCRGVGRMKGRPCTNCEGHGYVILSEEPEPVCLGCGRTWSACEREGCVEGRDDDAFDEDAMWERHLDERASFYRACEDAQAGYDTELGAW